MRQNFKLESANGAALWTLGALTLACFALAAAVTFGLSAMPMVAWGAAATCIGLGLLFGWFALAQQWSSVTIADRHIELRVPLYGRTLAIDEIVDGSPAKVNLAEQGRRLAWRTNGLSVPGYNLGWFRTQDNNVALAAVTGSNVVTWSTKAGHIVLISVPEADAFLSALSQRIAKA